MPVPRAYIAGERNLTHAEHMELIAENIEKELAFPGDVLVWLTRDEWELIVKTLREKLDCSK